MKGSKRVAEKMLRGSIENARTHTSAVWIINSNLWLFRVPEPRDLPLGFMNLLSPETTEKAQKRP